MKVADDLFANADSNDVMAVLYLVYQFNTHDWRHEGQPIGHFDALTPITT